MATISVTGSMDHLWITYGSPMDHLWITYGSPMDPNTDVKVFHVNAASA